MILEGDLSREIFGYQWTFWILPAVFLLEIVGMFLYGGRSVRSEPDKDEKIANQKEAQATISGGLTLVGLTIAGFTIILPSTSASALGATDYLAGLEIFSLSMGFILFSIVLANIVLIYWWARYIQAFMLELGLISIVLALYYLVRTAAPKVGSVIIVTFITLLFFQIYTSIIKIKVIRNISKMS